MAVQCANCGEELLGAVNRCWRCGHEFEAHSGPSNLPPIRRAPPKPVAASLADSSESSESAESSQPESSEASSESASPSAVEERPLPIRRGSPFADRGTFTTDPPPPNGLAPTTRPHIRNDSGAAAAAALTLPIGILGLILAAYFPVGGLAISCFGIAIGTWGLYSQRRGVALAGLIVCCLCLAISGFNAAIELYVHLYGVAPWESNEPLLTP